MKNKLLLTGIYILLHFYEINGFSQDTSKMSAYFIGSHGYLLQSSTKKVAIDALIYWTGNVYGYIAPPLAIAKKMELSEKPFDSIDLILISHAHSEHYNTGIIEKVMLKNKNTIMIIPQEVYDIIKNSVDSLEKYNDRIIVPHISFYHSFDTIVKDIPITITNLAHGPDRKMNLFTYSFVMDSIRILHLNQWNDVTLAMLDTLGFNKKRADVAFIGSDYITDNNKFLQFKKMNPRFSEMSHIDGATATKLNQIQQKINLYKQQYPIDLMDISMEQLLFKKTDDTIIVDTLNNAPDLNLSLKDTSININTPFTFSTPEHLFSDKDGDSLTYTCTLSNGSSLPGWLIFDSLNMTLSGTPVEKSVLNIKIAATDPDIAIKSTIFKITVTDNTKISNSHLDDNFKISPNPNNGKFTLSFGNKQIRKATIKIYNSEGKLILEKNIQNTLKTDIDLLNNAYGPYIIRLYLNEETLNKKVIIY